MRSWFAVYDSYRSKIPELYCLGASPAVTSWVGAVYDGDLCSFEMTTQHDKKTTAMMEAA